MFFSLDTFSTVLYDYLLVGFPSPTCSLSLKCFYLIHRKFIRLCLVCDDVFFLFVCLIIRRQQQMTSLCHVCMYLNCGRVLFEDLDPNLNNLSNIYGTNVLGDYYLHHIYRWYTPYSNFNFLTIISSRG